MKIEANDKEIGDVFKLGYFKIPRFQRPYSWEKDEVENFWDDVIKGNTEEYFIGSMVVYQDKKPYFGIVDGQQRLTTITLILSAIRDAFLELGEENLAKGVHKYVEQPNIDNENEFVLLAETSYPYLQNHIQSYNEVKLALEVGNEEKKLKYAFELISNKVKGELPSKQENSSQLELIPQVSISIDKLKFIRDKVLSLKLVFIQLDNEDDAYLIFETLNARGRDLKTSDLVKNLILKTIKQSNVNIDTPKEAWSKLTNRFDDINENDALDSFLQHYWISKESYSSDKELFSKIKKEITDKSKAQQLLTNLTSNSVYYCKMLNPDYFDWDNNEGSQAVKRVLISLKKFKVKQQSSFVLAMLRAHADNLITLSNLKQTFEKIEYFHFVFNAITSQRSSGQIVSIYSRHAILLTNSKDANEANEVCKKLFSQLKKKIPNYEEFEVKFLELAYLKNKTKDKNLIKYCLTKILPKNMSCLDINHETLSVEHIIPQSSKTYSEEIIGNIGNLILVDSKTNAEQLKNNPVKKKFEILESANYPFAKSFLSNEEWNQQSVINRAKVIAKELYNSGKF